MPHPVELFLDPVYTLPVPACNNNRSSFFDKTKGDLFSDT